MKEKQIIKNCPFCGRKAELRHNKEGFSYVVCANDGCYVRTDGCLNEDEAIDSWNRRILLDNLKKEILIDKDQLLSTRNDCITLSEYEVNAAQEYVYDRVLNIIEREELKEKAKCI